MVLNVAVTAIGTMDRRLDPRKKDVSAFLDHRILRPAIPVSLFSNPQQTWGTHQADNSLPTIKQFVASYGSWLTLSECQEADRPTGCLVLLSKATLSMSWTKTISSVGKDGYRLARALAKSARAKGITAQSSNVVRPILLDHARQSNRVATSMLKVDKEVGLVRYWGLWGYVRQRLSSSSASPAGDNAISNSSNSEKEENGKKVRVAFMITSAMKSELTDQLGYDSEQVKKMTPVQASLLLNNKVPSEEMESQLPILEKKNAEEEEKEQQRRRKEEEKELQRKQEEEQLRMQQNVMPNTETSNGGGTVYELHRDSISTTTEDGFASANILDSNNENAWGRGSSWYEVVETQPNGESSRVGLYLVEEEAQLGMETRQMVADRKGMGNTYELRQINGEELYEDFSA